MTDAADRIRDLKEALRRYLRARPEAADTPIGIAQWWVPELMPGISVEQLQMVLSELVATHEARRLVLPDGTEMFSGPSEPA